MGGGSSVTGFLSDDKSAASSLNLRPHALRLRSGLTSPAYKLMSFDEGLAKGLAALKEAVTVETPGEMFWA